jgi:threonine dehydrogenase-like Zn-dependent dehydrogenase
MLRPGGTLVLIGIPEAADRIWYDPHLMRRREITVVNVRRQNRATERALSLLERRRDAPAVLLTHRFPPRRAKEAFDLVHRKADSAIKVLIDLSAS